MIHLFGKKEAVTEECLTQYQQKRDWPGLVRAYYQMGAAAMEEGRLNQAQLWLSRADTIYSADDTVYKKAGKKLVDDCSDRIGQLEDEALFYNEVPARIEEMAENISEIKVRVWGLLSLARLVKLGERLAALPGCEVFGKLGWAVDTILKSLQGPPSEEEYNGLQELSGALYELGDSPAFWGMGSEIPVPGKEPFQVFDFNGLMGVHLEIDAYTHNHLSMVCALGQGQDTPEPETGIIMGALFPDYYVRTGADILEEVPGIKAELERIYSDYDFVCSDVTWEQIGERVETYKKLDILA